VSERKMTCNYQYPKNRTDFKLVAALCHLERLKQIKNKAGGVGHFKTQVAIDGLLTELIGAKDSLLHEINRELKLGLSSRNATDLEKIKNGLKRKRLNSRTILKDILNIYKSGWLWQLNNYRNYSIHENIIQRHIIVGAPHIIHFGLSNPEDPASGLGPEIVSYFEKTLQRMCLLIKNIREEIKRLT